MERKKIIIIKMQKVFLKWIRSFRSFKSLTSLPFSRCAAVAPGDLSYLSASKTEIEVFFLSVRMKGRLVNSN